MTADAPTESHTELEQELAIRFSRLKESDLQQLSPPPLEQALPPHNTARRNWIVTGSIAAAMIVAVSATLLRPKQTEDPATVYLAIMSHHVVTTDTLLVASPGILPEQGNLPEIYPLHFADDFEESMKEYNL